MAIVKAVRHPGRSSSKVAKQCGISRQRVHQVLNAFDAGGMKAVVN
ncbi:helix-turn-helix domain-containing protein [Corynebacterium tuberculostearicum]